jgi:tetratricopeptide (TPR) repeat protein/predicted O-methyltransferase YrrM
MASFWDDVSKMVDENYAREYEHNDVLVMAAHHHHSIETIKDNNPGHGKIIIYQLEPLNKSHWWNEDYIIPILKGADEVWDYDLDNIEKLKSHGIDAKFRPFLYTEALKRVKNSSEPDIDILFYGTLTEYRYKFLEKINHCGMGVGPTVCAFGLTKELLDELIGRSKIIIDLQLTDSENFIQKQTRLYYALINNKCVLSGKGSKNYYGDLFVEVDNNIDEVLNKATFLLTTGKWKEYSDISKRFEKMTIESMIDNTGITTELKDNIAIFYHLYQINDWTKLYQEQINSLIVSGLYEKCDFIHIGINGDQELPFVLDKMKVSYNENKILEANTLNSLWDFCNENPHHKVLYFHSKGVTHLNNNHCQYTTNAWRIYLEYFVINKWEDCIRDLNEYDCVGSEWMEYSVLCDPDTQEYVEEINPHYSGNFWWANASYIKKLDLNFIYNEDRGHGRYQSEFWIGTKNPNYKSYHNSGRHFLYDFNYSPNYYMDDRKKMKTEIDLVVMKTEDKIKKMQEITTAWTDHVVFAQWLVNRITPKVIVDLGVDYGYSTFSFAIPQIGHVYGIDCFEGDYNSGIRNTLENVNESKKNLELDNITFIKGYFDEIAKLWDKPIDILHIDGYHAYESVKNDYETWSKFLNDDGIILFHDTMVEDENFGVKKFFEEIDLPKVNFTCSCGLGVVSKNKEMIEEISKFFNLPLYDYQVKKEEFIEPLSLTHKKSKIVMISMFKNESKGIRRMLESVYKYIDFYVFQDNGSTDGTPEIVEEFFADKNIPGFIYKVEEGWVGFGWNRDHLLQTCMKTDHGCDWIMKMDCDEYLEVDDDFDWSPFYNKDTECFHVTAKAPGCIYYRTWIWNAKLPWKFYHDVAHECIYLDNGRGENYQAESLPRGLRMIGTSDGESYTVRTKYISDALKLEEKLIREETMLTDLYHFWYTAKSYHDCYAGDFYPLSRDHSEEFARRFIFYYKKYLEIINAQGIHEMSYFSTFAIGEGYEYLGDYPEAIRWYQDAEKYCPERNEHIIHLALLYDKLGQHEKMLEQTSRLMDPSRKLPFPQYCFLLNDSIYNDSSDYPKYLHDYALAKMNEEKTINSFSVNIQTKPRLWIVDDFYADPHTVREFALQQEFEANLNYYKGSRSNEQHIVPGTKEAFEKIMGRKIENWAETHGMCGRFQYCTAEDSLVYHCDSQTFAGMVYLTPDAPFSCGTSLYAHKGTRLRNENDFAETDVFGETGFYDKSKFELVDTAGNVFNRLVIFDAKCIHSASEYFGQTKQNSRLFHLFFFD